MFKTRKRISSLIILTAITCFILGFSAAQSIQKTDWIGHLVRGISTDIDPSIYPEPSGFSPGVDGTIIIGLREDGVVVWKHAGNSDE